MAVTRRLAAEADGDLMVLNLGPQHPSTHGVLRLELWLDGEVCVRAVPHLGYLHRGVEKLCESLSWVQLPAILDKNDYVAPITNEWSAALAVEALLGIEAPPRAQWLRSALAELQRVASHLLWLGTFALDMGGALGGGATLFMHTFRERETLLDCFEALTGARFHYNTLVVGGCRHDPPAGWDRAVKAALATVLARIEEYEAFVREDPIFGARTRGVGVLPASLARGLGVSGPNLRGSGVDWDLRRDTPYGAYGRVEVRVATATAGDAYARFEVRMAELRESIRLCGLFLDGLPEGALNALKPAKLPGAVKAPAGRAYAAVESPRGELGVWAIGDGGDKPARLRIRAPSFHAVSALPYLCRGATVSDVVVILGSLDPILGEVDR